MGTDIYLEIPNDEKEYGYLRASIGREKENAFLRMVFSEKFWIGCESLRFEFTDEGLEVLRKVGDRYIDSYRIGSEFGTYKNELGSFVKDMMKTQGFTIVDRNKQVIEAQHWFEDLIEFYKKGIELEKKNLKPEVCISW